MRLVTTRRGFSSTGIVVPFAPVPDYERFGPLGVLIGVGTGGSTTTLAQDKALTYFLDVGTGGSATREFVTARGDWGYSFAGFEWLQLVRKALVEKTLPEKIARVREVLVPAMTDLATLLRVSRRAVYDWQEGKEIAPDNLKRVDELAKAADVLDVAGLRGTSSALRRPIKGGKTFFQLVKGGSSAEDAARSLVRMLRVETDQRESLEKRFAGRKRRSSREMFEDFGAPMLNEEDR